MLSLNKILSGIIVSIFLLPLFVNAAPASLAVYSGTIISNNPDFSPKVMVEFPFSINRSEMAFFRADSTDTKLYGRVFAQVDLISASG